MEKIIGPYKISRRTEYSKLKLTDRFGNDIDKEIYEKIIEDYTKQKESPNKYFRVVDGKLVGFATMGEIRYVFIPNDVMSLEPNIFIGSKLNYMHIPEGVINIKRFAFNMCEIKEIDLPDSARIEEGIFNECKFLERVKLPKNLNVISVNMFCGCENLKEIILPDSIQYISDEAFKWCASLKKINFPKNLVTLGEQPFAYSMIESILFTTDAGNNASTYGNFIENSLINKIEIDESVKYISANIFRNVNGIKKIDYNGSKENFEKFKENNKELFEVLGDVEIKFKSGLDSLINKDSYEKSIEVEIER